ncbi:MAG: hypothetical protein IE936_13015, partial [Moraxella osloensis]|nr:hypothetical protein [Moraxella osloensis]
MMSTKNNQRPTILRPMFTMMSLFCLLIVSGFIYAAQNVMNFDSNINEAVLAISPDIPTIWRGAGGQQTITITNKGPDSANNTFATYTEQPTAGVTISSVTLSNGTVC